MSREMYDTDQPWVIYRYLSTDRETRLTGRSRVECECAICGTVTRLRIKIPRFGKVVPVGKQHVNGKHVERLRFLQAHVHPDRPHPMSWARPLLNAAAHRGGVDLDLLAMRLEADLRDAVTRR